MKPKKKKQHGAVARSRCTTSGGRASSSSRRSTRSSSTGSSGVKALLIPLMVIAVLAITAWSFYPVAKIQYQEVREKARLETELAGLKERNADLRAQVDRLKTPEGVEQIARESLGMIREGENLYVVTNLSEPATMTATDYANLSDPRPTFTQGILDTIFGVE